MGFFEKYAKLESQVNSDNKKVSIQMFDTESEDPSKPVMWLDGTIKYDGDTPSEIYIEVINFNNNSFFAMPEDKQDKCGTLLMRKFMKYYNDNWGKNTAHWLPVNADFLNYKLQEMVENGIERGFFNPDSLKNSKLTTKEQWDAEPDANMENRKLRERFKANPSDFFPEIQFNNNGYVVNTPLSVVVKSYTDFINTYPFFKKEYGELVGRMMGSILDGNVYVLAPFKGYKQMPGATEFTYIPNDDFVTVEEDVDDAISDRIINLDIVNLFDNVSSIKFWDDSIDKNTVISRLQGSQTTAQIKRLRRS